MQTYYTSTSADERREDEFLRERINNGRRNEISNRTRHEVVSGERYELMQVLTEQLDTFAQGEPCVLVIDLRVKRIDLPPEVSQSAYNRFDTERDIEAREHRAKRQELTVGMSQLEVQLVEARKREQSR